MNGYRAKAIAIAILLAGFAVIYFRTPLGDRTFALGVWLVVSLIAGCVVLLLPVLRCPDCGQATEYFDNYNETTDRLRGGRHRHVKCKYCQSVIDRLDRSVVHRYTAVEGRNLDRIDFLLGMWLVLLAAGVSLIFLSIVVGIIVVVSALSGSANSDHALVVRIGCIGVFVIGFILVVTGWSMKRRAHRFAEQNRIHFPKKTRIRW